MRKNIRRIFSIILAAILLLCASLPVFAKSEKCSCGTPPVIYVAALGSAKLYLDKGTENERLLFRPDIAAYLRLAARLAPAIARLAIDKNYDAFGDALIDGVRGVFGDLQMDENGDSTDRVTSDAKLPDNPDHGVDKSYYFAYDFREDPLTVADRTRHRASSCLVHGRRYDHGVFLQIRHRRHRRLHIPVLPHTRHAGGWRPVHKENRH